MLHVGNGERSGCWGGRGHTGIRAPAGRTWCGQSLTLARYWWPELCGSLRVSQEAGNVARVVPQAGDAADRERTERVETGKDG